MKPPGRKRRQVKHKLTEATVEAGEENEESDSEEESPPQADSGLPHARLNCYVFRLWRVGSFHFPRCKKKSLLEGSIYM
jgi:hypothetical protein